MVKRVRRALGTIAAPAHYLHGGRYMVTVYPPQAIPQLKLHAACGVKNNSAPYVASMLIFGETPLSRSSFLWVMIDRKLRGRCGQCFSDPDDPKVTT